jgi:penicillin-binding protein 1A
MRSQDPPEFDSPGHKRSQVLWWIVGLVSALLVSGALLLAVIVASLYPKLPDVSELANYQPKLPLRIYAADGSTLLGEFGEEKRTFVPIKEMPEVMKNAILAIEDARFYRHSGVDYIGLLRASLANLQQAKSQGASTITMQVARNVYLSTEKTFARKLKELLLTYKLEQALSKDQILEIYMNQIFLGNRSYGFASASDNYFGTPLKNISIAQAAMLAGLPKAPSAFNPINNPQRARIRQLHIIERMLDNGFITAAQAKAAKEEQLRIRPPRDDARMHAEFLSEMVRQIIVAQFGEDSYTRGLNVYTTVSAAEQMSAYRALRNGIMDFERRQAYRGPERQTTLPSDPQQWVSAVDDVLDDHPDNGDVFAAVVTDANTRKISALRHAGERLEISGEGLRPVQSGLSDKASPQLRIRAGSVIRVVKNSKGAWEATQLPEVEGAIVALQPQTGAVRALVGGFDYNKNKFNHVTQAWRQPGSSFKPFVYSAALEKGISPATVVNDSPLFFDAQATGSEPWEPKNYDGTFDGPMTLQRGLAKSKNMVSIRVLQAIGPAFAQEWVTKFGFEASKHPPYLTMALGAGSVTPMQMATAYAVFANGGYRIQPHLIERITDAKGEVLLSSKPAPAAEEQRAIPARNAFLMSQLLQEVTRSGTAARAQGMLKRPDLYGKTGTTNDAMDAWFAGYQKQVVSVVWMGYDNPKKLGDRETGGGLSLPVWIQYMQTALQGVPVEEVPSTEGVVFADGHWFYNNFSAGEGVSSIGLDEKTGSVPAPRSQEERKGILDLFRQ